jgi:hypothetical protein
VVDIPIAYHSQPRLQTSIGFGMSEGTMIYRTICRTRTTLAGFSPTRPCERCEPDWQGRTPCCPDPPRASALLDGPAGATGVLLPLAGHTLTMAASAEEKRPTPGRYRCLRGEVEPSSRTVWSRQADPAQHLARLTDTGGSSRTELRQDWTEAGDNRQRIQLPAERGRPLRAQRPVAPRARRFRSDPGRSAAHAPSRHG